MYPIYTPTEMARGALDGRMVAAMRLVLAASALLIIYMDPSEPDRYEALTYGALIGYTVYSATVYGLMVCRNPFVQYIRRRLHWVDIGWYLLLIGLSSGANSIFFLFFFFAVLTASFQWGFAPGLRAAVVSSVLFTVIGYMTAPPSPQFKVNLFLLRPIYLLVLGYMTAYWGGHVILSVRRLAFLRETNMLFNPRFGVNHAISSIMERLRAFYEAHSCLLLMIEPDTKEYCLYRAHPDASEEGIRIEAVKPDLAHQLLVLPSKHAGIFRGESCRCRLWGHGCYVYDIDRDLRTWEERETCTQLATLLDADSFITIPLVAHGETTGRVFITFKRRCTLKPSDIDFLFQVFDQTMPVLDNIRLVDRLASDAAEAERQRIAHNIHDSVIQPYVGFRLGLVALRQKLEAAGADEAPNMECFCEAVGSATHQIEQLVEWIDGEIQNLRCYVNGVKEPDRHGSRGLTEPDRHGSRLLASLHRFAARFSEATSIAVAVEAAEDAYVSDRLAAELFQMVAEGLSNIRRHTRSERAVIRMERRNSHVVLEIENEVVDEPAPDRFVPRSIASRTEALGGHLNIEREPDRTRLTVEVPL